MPKIVDLTGRRFGKLVALRIREPRGRRMVWICQCDCGKTSEVMSAQLTFGKTRSCGCLIGEGCRKRLTTHGMTRSPENRIWRVMKSRCSNKRFHAYRYYGGRGIKVCERWALFVNFFADMGPRPSPTHSLDRIDSNGNYEPGNCRWADKFTQANNRRRKSPLGIGITASGAKFVATITKDNRIYHLGTFDTVGEASKVRSLVAEFLYGHH